MTSFKFNPNADIFVPRSPFNQNLVAHVQNTANTQSALRDNTASSRYDLFDKTQGVLTVAQMIELLIPGCLRSFGMEAHIDTLNCMISAFYASVDPVQNNYIATMTIDCRLLNDFVDLFAENHSVHVKQLPRSSNSGVNDVVSFSLQSQETHHIPRTIDYDIMWNGNLISMNNSVYNIASDTMYRIPHFLHSPRNYIGVCASKQRGIFCIGGYREDKDRDSVKAAHNIRWSWDNSNPSKCTFGAVVPLAPYFHDTWSSMPLFIDNDNKVINIGGGEGRRGHCSNIVGLYDFEANTWSRIADIPYRSQDSGACYNEWDETIYATGSYHDRTRLCVKYYGRKNRWEPIGIRNWECVTPCISVVDNVLVLVIHSNKWQDTYTMRMEYLDTRTSATTFTILVGAAEVNEKMFSYRNICRQCM
eukprot:255553_1